MNLFCRGCLVIVFLELTLFIGHFINAMQQLTTFSKVKSNNLPSPLIPAAPRFLGLLGYIGG